MKSRQKIEKQMTKIGWMLVAESSNIRDLRDWQLRLEEQGATTAVIRASANGGKYGPARVFTLWTDEAGSEFLNYYNRLGGVV